MCPMPLIEDVVDAVAGSPLLTAGDATSGFHQIMVLKGRAAGILSRGKTLQMGSTSARAHQFYANLSASIERSSGTTSLEWNIGVC